MRGFRVKGLVVGRGVPCRTAREERRPAIELQNAWRESCLGIAVSIRPVEYEFMGFMAMRTSQLTHKYLVAIVFVRNE